VREIRRVERKPPALAARPTMFVRRPPLPFNIDIAPDPLKALGASPDTTPIEQETAEALDAVTQAFRDAEKRQMRDRGVNETGYYRVMVFCDEAQADAFMRAVGQNPNDIYCDGRRVCDRLGIALPPDSWNLKRRTNVPNKRLAALARPILRRRIDGEKAGQESSQEASQEGQRESQGGEENVQRTRVGLKTTPSKHAP
jgi:hypothetical protein